MSLKFFRLPEKDVLAAKLIDYPFLNSILRMLLYERVFRFVIVGLLLLVVGTALFISKIWTASPEGFSPVIKLSGLDYVQAWSLRRTAEKQMAQGRYDDALYSWRVAVANNPVDPGMLRGCLTHLLQGTDPKKCIPTAVGYSRWLLRLTETNHVDVELATRLYQHFGLDDLTIQCLAPLEKQLTPAMEAAYLKALFNRGRLAQFAARWEDAQLRAVTFPDPDLALYHAAYEAGWGLVSNAAEAKKQLAAAKEDPARRILAHRLQLKISEKLVEPGVYQKTLEFLRDWRQDRLQDHIGYWQLLARIGRKAEALRLIDAHVTPPSSGDETVLLAKACYDLGQQDKSRDILKRYALEFSDSEAVWLSYSNLLIAQQRWDNLVEVALLIRHDGNPLRDALVAYSHYIEGLAEFGLGRRSKAADAFRRIITARIKNPVWELSIAQKLEMLGFPDITKEILLDIQKDHPDNSQFWMLLAKTAFDLKEPDLLVSALASAYKLRPNDLGIINNYAAALLATRQRPDEALRLTSALVEKAPGAITPLINHALALLQNQRLADAETLLGRIDAAQLGAAELSSYHLAHFELFYAQKRFDQARQSGERVNAQYLMPTEMQWFNDAREEMQKNG